MQSTLAPDAHALRNGSTVSSVAQEETLFTQLARLRDAVVSGRHRVLKLPTDVIEQLKRTLAATEVPSTSVEPPNTNGLWNGASSDADVVNTDLQQRLPPQVPAYLPGLPGLQPASNAPSNPPIHPWLAKPPPSGGLDPIFLEKSEDLIRAEVQLKRQRIERELQGQAEQRKHSIRDKDPVGDAPLSIDIEAILARAHDAHISGLKLDGANGDGHDSFDENDYYSSRVQSEWSSPGSTSKDGAIASSTDVKRPDEPVAPASFHKNKASGKLPITAREIPSQSLQDTPLANELEAADAFEADDEDDEYVPPDATAFDIDRHDHYAVNMLEDTPDDNSDYEPGEIPQEIIAHSNRLETQPAPQLSPNVPVIRNHLTHIAAPQPSRVSPLAVAKSQSIELELVNGRPEVRHRLPQNQHISQSRASTASPSANGVAALSKKKRNKKRKRDSEQAIRPKKKRDRHSAPQPLHIQNEPGRVPYIKDEPLSPAPFEGVPELPAYTPTAVQFRPTEIGHASHRQAAPGQLAQHLPRSNLSYDYGSVTEPVTIRVASPAAYRPVQRDSQDLRRVLHAPMPPGLTQRGFSPAQPYRTTSMTYGESRVARPSLAPTGSEAVRYHGAQVSQARPSRVELSPSPPRAQEYAELYTARAPSPVSMPPPTAPPMRIVIDQFGNKYSFAPEPAPAARVARASALPAERHPAVETSYERAPSRMQVAYAQPRGHSQYDDDRMAPPPPPPSYRRQAFDEALAQHVEANGYSSARDYGAHHYGEPPLSPARQASFRYEKVPPPPVPPSREQTSPMYMQRAYSTRPDENLAAVSTYASRQASVAPAPFPRQDVVPAPTRAMSVMPGFEPTAMSVARAARPPPVVYVDQYGRELYPRDVQQVTEYRYP